MNNCLQCDDADLKQVQPLEKGYRYFICGGHDEHLLRQPIYDVQLDYPESDVIRPRFLMGNLELVSR